MPHRFHSLHSIARLRLVRSVRSGGRVALATAALAGCSHDSTSPTATTASNVVYVLSNTVGANQNSVLAFTRAADGTLTTMAGSPYATGGSGVDNPTQALGPDDVDFPIAMSADRKRLFAVNPGSNTIAVFNISSTGALTAVAGSPFSSGGINPSSVGVAGDKIYVVNKANDPAQGTGGVPNYTGFAVSSTGALTPIAGSTVNTIVGASPQMALVSPSKSLLFGSDFLAPTTASHQGALRAFVIGASGTLTTAAGTPLDIPGDAAKRVVLGLASHPTQNVLYAGFVAQNLIGVYSYDGTSGALTFRTTAANSGKATCWIITNASGSALYTSNTADNSVSWYNSTNALAPVEMQHLVLKEGGVTYTDPMGNVVPTSEVYELSLDPTGKFLYVLANHTNPDFTVTNGNILHTLVVAADGSLSEPSTPTHLAVSTHTRPMGVVVF